jgi:hypothetical protein
LVQTYDFISDTAIEVLKAKAMEYSTLPVNINHYPTPSNVVFSWLNDSDISKVSLSRKIELFTGLKVRGKLASEALQISTLTVGDHEALHIDSVC